MARVIVGRGNKRMLFPLKHEIIEEAEAHWRGGRPLDAGRVIYDCLGREHRPNWAADALELACSLLSSIPPEVQVVIETARDPARWRAAYNAFQAVRQLTLRSESLSTSERVPLHDAVLYLAENTAKVTYNASGDPAPFDYNAGWWIVATLHHVTTLADDAEISTRAWEIVSGATHSQSSHALPMMEGL